MATLLSIVIFFSILAFVLVLPVKWSAEFVNAERTGFPVCLLASIAGPVVAVMVFRIAHGGFNGFVLSYLAMLAAYVTVLRVPAGSIMGFATILLALQLATGMALISFGRSVPKLLFA